MEEVKKSQVDLVYSIKSGLNCSGFIRELSKRNKYDLMVVFGTSSSDEEKKVVEIDINKFELNNIPSNFNLVDKILVFTNDEYFDEVEDEINEFGDFDIEIFRVDDVFDRDLAQKNHNGYKKIWSVLMNGGNILIEDRNGDYERDFYDSFHITSRIKEGLKIPHSVIFDNIYKVINDENLVVNSCGDSMDMRIFAEEIMINSVDNIVVVDCEKIEEATKLQKFQSPEDAAKFAKLSEFLGSLGRVQGESNMGLPSNMKFYFQTGYSEEYVSGPFEWGQLRMANVKVGNGPKPYEFPEGFKIPDIKIAHELDDID